jgi:release factor glutamine methyltransferase
MKTRWFFTEKLPGSRKHLAKDGKLYFEINQYLGKEMMGLLGSLDFKSLNLRQDIYGNDRMLKADR